MLCRFLSSSYAVKPVLSTCRLKGDDTKADELEGFRLLEGRQSRGRDLEELILGRKEVEFARNQGPQVRHSIEVE